MIVLLISACVFHKKKLIIIKKREISGSVVYLLQLVFILRHGNQIISYVGVMVLFNV